jgi:zinc and cadmium transporter
VSALFAIVGTILTLIIATQINNLSYILLAIAGGGFVYIAGSDLVPELHKCEFRTRDAVLQLIAIIVGIVVMASMLMLE